MNKASKRFADVCLFVGGALIVCVIAVGAFVTAEACHVSPMWVFFPLLSVGFFAGIGWDYRREFRSFRFVLFFGVWVLLNFGVFFLMQGYMGYYPMALFAELFLFYATAYWFFGLHPPVRGQRTR